jgi:hypothetical protein
MEWFCQVKEPLEAGQVNLNWFLDSILTEQLNANLDSKR